MKVTISRGNSKMGNISSVSLPAILTCRRDCYCENKCYALKLEHRRENVRKSYYNNLKLLTDEPEVYWRGVESSIMVSRFFRFHVSGDIPNYGYLERMMLVAERNPDCNILCFTKKYELVNSYLANGKTIPENLHIIFSVWPDVNMENKWNIPEAHVRFRNGYTTASDNHKECGGNCLECATSNSGCWNMKSGEQVVFNEH